MDAAFAPLSASAHEWNVLWNGLFMDVDTGLYFVNYKGYQPRLGIRINVLAGKPEHYSAEPEHYSAEPEISKEDARMLVAAQSILTRLADYQREVELSGEQFTMGLICRCRITPAPLGRCENLGEIRVQNNQGICVGLIDWLCEDICNRYTVLICVHGVRGKNWQGFEMRPFLMMFGLARRLIERGCLHI
jgi:hypothetical protein